MSSLAVTSADLAFSFDDAAHTIGIEAEVAITGRTGVEMEALTAVSVAALTIYDMCKAVQKDMRIENIRLSAPSAHSPFLPPGGMERFWSCYGLNSWRTDC